MILSMLNQRTSDVVDKMVKKRTGKNWETAGFVYQSIISNQCLIIRDGLRVLPMVAEYITVARSLDSVGLEGSGEEIRRLGRNLGVSNCLPM